MSDRSLCCVVFLRHFVFVILVCGRYSCSSVIFLVAVAPQSCHHCHQLSRHRIVLVPSRVPCTQTAHGIYYLLFIILLHRPEDQVSVNGLLSLSIYLLSFSPPLCAAQFSLRGVEHFVWNISKSSHTILRQSTSVKVVDLNSLTHYRSCPVQFALLWLGL